MRKTSAAGPGARFFTPLAAAFVIAAALAAPAFAYTVYLKDGSRLVATERPVIEGDQAIITLQSGTRTSIAASEIDFERTNEANQDDYGTALVVEDGSPSEAEHDDGAARRGRLSELSAGPTIGSRPRARRQATVGSGQELESWQRVAYRANLDIATEVLEAFRAQGVEQVGIYQGTTEGRLLIELTTSSESAVFRGLKIAAGALSRVHGLYPDEVTALELVMSTGQRERAGQFVLTPEDAALLLADGTELSSFFVANVRF